MPSQPKSTGEVIWIRELHSWSSSWHWTGDDCSASKSLRMRRIRMWVNSEMLTKQAVLFCPLCRCILQVQKTSGFFVKETCCKNAIVSMRNSTCRFWLRIQGVRERKPVAATKLFSKDFIIGRIEWAAFEATGRYGGIRAELHKRTNFQTLDYRSRLLHHHKNRSPNVCDWSAMTGSMQANQLCIDSRPLDSSHSTTGKYWPSSIEEFWINFSAVTMVVDGTEACHRSGMFWKSLSHQLAGFWAIWAARKYHYLCLQMITERFQIHAHKKYM